MSITQGAPFSVLEMGILFQYHKVPKAQVTADSHFALCLLMCNTLNICSLDLAKK